MTPEQIAELRAVWSRFVAEQTLSARTRVVDEFIGCRRISALLDAAERCAELERRFANLEMHSCAVAKAADRMRAHEKVQDEMLRAAIARMRPVVEAAVAEYRAADPRRRPREGGWVMGDMNEAIYRAERNRHPLLTDELAHPLALAAVARAERSRIVAWLRGLNVFHGDEPRRIAECIERGDHAKGGG